jgi:hypothetical protein
VLLTLATLFNPLVAAGCDLKYDPAFSLSLQFVRPEGWALPGIQDFRPDAPVNHNRAFWPPAPSLPGLKVTPLPHDDDFVAEFPSQEFLLNGSRKRLRPTLARVAILRLELNGKVFAYTYMLIPVGAHRSDGKWKVDWEAGCTFAITFIDDRGDGVFRVLMYNGLTPDAVPAWVKDPSHS